MAFIECHFFSEVLRLSTSVNVILPETARGQIGMAHAPTRHTYPVLYLLHGLSDDHSIWMRRTSIERYVAELGIAVVMPNGHRSFYSDMSQGLPYFSFMSDELPERMKAFFPLSREREDTFVAGLSMGGYGALKLALRCPEQYGAAASLSGCVDLARQVREQDYRADFDLIFGRGVDISQGPDDLLWLAQTAQQSGQELPRLFQCCGTEDFLFTHNQTFQQHLTHLGIPLTTEFDSGEHEWGYWDRKIQSVLRWLAKQTKPALSAPA